MEKENKGKLIFVDIDETICHYGDLIRDGPTNYELAMPDDYKIFFWPDASSTTYLAKFFK